MSTSTTPDLEAYAVIGAAGAFVMHVADAMRPIGEGIHTEQFEKLLREHWGEDYEDVAEFHRAEALQHERFAGHMRDLAEELVKDAKRYEELAETEWERMRHCESAS
jgi:hypothetical protein